jgi:hypothetical protein
MSIKAQLSKIVARIIYSRTQKWSKKPIESQKKVFESLIKRAKSTAFGKDHHFDKIQSVSDFQKRVPVRDYEGLKTYVERIKEGENDILWPGKPLYFAKTSGTTSGAKYIPITKESMPFHVEAARNALLLYINETGNTSFVDGKLIFLQGSPEMEEINGIQLGRLSGIVAHYVPGYLQRNRMPSWETNCIDDWETKVDAIVGETLVEDMRLISGIPSWMLMYFERVVEQTGKKIKDVWPNFSLFVNGGVAFEPYRVKFEEMIGKPIDTLELYPASEGFFAYQDSQKEQGLLLLLNQGIFYEFIPADQFFEENPPRLTIGEVELGVNYALVISTNAGLWGYNIGDTVQFVSKDPYRIIVSGRIKHYTSAFGEHVIASEVEAALKASVAETDARVVEFTVAPQIAPSKGLPYHEWLIEFDHKPADMDQFSMLIDKSMQQKNIYYADLIKGKVLRPLVITAIKPGGFTEYMKSIGRLGGQNKVSRLSNDRKIADALREFSE